MVANFALGLKQTSTGPGVRLRLFLACGLVGQPF